MQCRGASKAKPRLDSIGRQAFVIALAAATPVSAAPAQNLTLPGDRDFILQIDAGDPWVRLAVHTAIGGAYRRLASPECQQVLSDFSDGNGRTLLENLETTGVAAPEYLGALRYANGARRGTCARKGVLAFTSPNTRIIYLCAEFRDRFLSMRHGDREDLEVTVIHEALHTLGLRENPPSSQQITDQIRRRCSQ